MHTRLYTGLQVPYHGKIVEKYKHVSEKNDKKLKEKVGPKTSEKVTKIVSESSDKESDRKGDKNVLKTQQRLCDCYGQLGWGYHWTATISWAGDISTAASTS